MTFKFWQSYSDLYHCVYHRSVTVSSGRSWCSEIIKLKLICKKNSYSCLSHIHIKGEETYRRNTWSDRIIKITLVYLKEKVLQNNDNKNIHNKTKTPWHLVNIKTMCYYITYTRRIITDLRLSLLRHYS